MADDTASPTEPCWLLWAREMQALAQTGVAFTLDQYDRERYQQLRALAAKIMADHTGIAMPDIEVMFTQQTGYATPKLGVRGAVFRDDRILLVRETADEHRWTLPGGWADVNESPAEAVAREVREEAGLQVRPTRLAAVWDRARHPHGMVQPSMFGGCSFCAKSSAVSPKLVRVALLPLRTPLPDDGADLRQAGLAVLPLLPPPPGKGAGRIQAELPVGKRQPQAGPVIRPEATPAVPPVRPPEPLPDLRQPTDPKSY
jgi:ADP-ribose pyrophosphatase YjhB (NUDIX family)